MTSHFKFEEVKTLVNAGIAVMLVGPAGSGKTTLAEQVAESLDLPFYPISMTRQTTLSHLIGYKSVTGEYIPQILREAVENGGVFLLDEIDAADANVLLCLNTIENGYVSFPDTIVRCHPSFRLMATANPQEEHHHYTGRSKLDLATLDRFDIIEVPQDETLEASLVDTETLTHIKIMREILKDHNSSKQVSMRDSIRFQARKNLNLLNGFSNRLLENSELMIEKYKLKIASIPKYKNQSECKTFEDLVSLLKHN